MATSSAFATSNGNIKYKITVTQNSQNVTNNTSNVSVTVNFYRTNTGYTTYGTGTVYCKINGYTYTAAVTSSQKITSSGINLFSKTLDIPHNQDGIKTLAVSAWINHSQFTAWEQGFSTVLTTIPRASTPTLSASSADMGATITISTNRASTMFTHTLTYTFGSKSGTIATGVAESTTWTIPKNLAEAIPNAASGIGSVTCETFNSGVSIGTKSVNFTATVPNTDEFKPTVSDVAISEATAGIAAKFGAFVQNKSKLAVAITAAGAYGSTITGYTTYIQAIPYHGQAFTSNLITASGTIGIQTTVTDSRGRTYTTSGITAVIVAYSQPTISAFSGYRSDSFGVQNYEGEYLNIAINFAISAVNNLNDKTYKIEYKTTDSETWVTIVSGSLYTYNENYLTAAIFNQNNSYVVRLTISDFFTEISTQFDVPTAFTLLDFRSTGKGVAFGKVSEKDALEIALNTEITGQAKIYAPSSDQADSGFLRLYRKDGTLAGFIATGTGGNGLNFHLYSGGAWSGAMQLSANGQPYFSSPVPINSGGTGATTNSGARKNIGVIYSNTDGSTVLAKANFTANGTNSGGGLAFISDTSDLSKFIIISYNLNVGTAITVTTISSNTLTVNYNNFGTLAVSGGSGNYKFNILPMTNP